MSASTPYSCSALCEKSGRARALRGFSLIELLVVIAIIGVLAGISLPALSGTLSSMNLKGSSNIIYSEFDLARQVASARNLPVQLRLYQDSSQTVDSNGNYPYRIIALVIPSSASNATTDEFLGQPLTLQGDVIINSSTTYSSLLNTSTSVASLPPISVTAEASSAPALVKGKPYIYFTFLPNGTMNLSTTDNSAAQNAITWTLTLVNKRSKAATIAGAPAANFVTLLLDVPTARARVYQP